MRICEHTYIHTYIHTYTHVKHFSILFPPSSIPEYIPSFAADVVQRAKSYVKAIAGGVGAYQDSRGNSYIR